MNQKIKRTRNERVRVRSATKGLTAQMRKIDNALRTAKKYVSELQRLPLTERELEIPRRRVLNRWNELREACLLPLNERKEELKNDKLRARLAQEREGEQ